MDVATGRPHPAVQDDNIVRIGDVRFAWPGAGGFSLAIERFALIAPRLQMTGQTDSLEAVVVPSGTGSATIEVELPSGLGTGPIGVVVDGVEVEYTRAGDVVSFDVAFKAETPLSWSVGR